MLPKVNHRIVVQTLTSDFRAATKFIEEPIAPLGKRDMLIKNVACGINASDVNFASGAYLPGVKPPFPCGFEAVGTVVAAGANAQLKEGDHCVYTEYGAFAEYTTIKKAFPLPQPDPQAIPLLVSGLTAAIALEINGIDIFNQKGDNYVPPKVGLVTAAAGGTGQFAVQLMRNAGIPNVIGTCSTEEKATFLRSIGATDMVNTSTQKLGVHLANNYKSGVNVAYESVGGVLLDSTVDNLAVNGKCIQIGFISNYQSEKGLASQVSARAGTLPVRLLTKSASINGFMLMNHPEHWVPAFQGLVGLIKQGKLVSKLDNGPGAGFTGLEAVPDAVDYMYSKKSIGKIIVNL